MHFRWWIVAPGRDLFEVRVIPEATASEMRAQYPGALCGPIPDGDTDLDRDPPDDRRTCEQCANLDRHRGRDGFRRCAAAHRGELPHVASRDYSPVPDIGRRCEGYR